MSELGAVEEPGGHLAEFVPADVQHFKGAQLADVIRDVADAVVPKAECH